MIFLLSHSSVCPKTKTASKNVDSNFLFNVFAILFHLKTRGSKKKRQSKMSCDNRNFGEEALIPKKNPVSPPLLCSNTHYFLTLVSLTAQSMFLWFYCKSLFITFLTPQNKTFQAPSSDIGKSNLFISIIEKCSSVS